MLVFFGAARHLKASGSWVPNPVLRLPKNWQISYAKACETSFCASSPHMVQCNFPVELSALRLLCDRVEAALKRLFGTLQRVQQPECSNAIHCEFSHKVIMAT